eukprot:TRINITY_DN19549_c0_g1_i1.p1 TRINITY_DN19549_c0_g1~~TRINITY_DN19549_c0_g1_i1.p1  ORF type:complete len:453 (+),score=35.43 TRINITY_DN19549_c0_g1_i1:32-1360(+)
MERAASSPFDDFPNEVLLVLLGFLDAKSLFQVKITCKRMQSLCSEVALWRSATLSLLPKMDLSVLNNEEFEKTCWALIHAPNALVEVRSHPLLCGPVCRTTAGTLVFAMTRRQFGFIPDGSNTGVKDLLYLGSTVDCGSLEPIVFVTADSSMVCLLNRRRGLYFLDLPALDTRRLLDLAFVDSCPLYGKTVIGVRIVDSACCLIDAASATVLTAVNCPANCAIVAVRDHRDHREIILYNGGTPLPSLPLSVVVSRRNSDFLLDAPQDLQVSSTSGSVHRTFMRRYLRKESSFFVSDDGEIIVVQPTDAGSIGIVTFGGESFTSSQLMPLVPLCVPTSWACGRFSNIVFYFAALCDKNKIYLTCFSVCPHLGLARSHWATVCSAPASTTLERVVAIDVVNFWTINIVAIVVQHGERKTGVLGLRYKQQGSVMGASKKRKSEEL